MTRWHDVDDDEAELSGLEPLRVEEPADDGVVVDHFLAARAEQLNNEIAAPADDLEYFAAPAYRDLRSHTDLLVDQVARADNRYNLDEVDVDDDEWVKEMGFPDPLGALRVWVDDDDIIERVRLSLHWRTRLADSSLSDAFDFAFLLINNYRRRQQERLYDFFEPERVASEPLSWSSLGKLRSRQREVMEQLDALGPRGATSIEGTETVGHGAKGKVELLLNLEGLLLGVAFDPVWLKTARIREISDGVVEAHRDARARFVPGEIHVGERERLVNEMSTLRNEVLAMMRRGFY